MAVLLPPLLRSRFDGGAVSSVSDFRRQLHTLQRSQAPGTQAPMRAMARPLAPAPRLQAPRAAQRPRLIASDGVLETESRPRRSHHTSELPRHHFAAETAFMSSRERSVRNGRSKCCHLVPWSHYRQYRNVVCVHCLIPQPCGLLLRTRADPQPGIPASLLRRPSRCLDRSRLFTFLNGLCFSC